MEMLKIHVSNLIAMEKKIHVAVTIVVMAFGLILATVGSAQSGHAQKNATSSASSAAKSAGGAMNKTAGNMTSSGGAAAKSAGGAMNKTAGNMTSSAGGAAGSNKTSGGNASSSNPLAKVPIIGKLFGK
jgi:hypothetical protein